MGFAEIGPLSGPEPKLANVLKNVFGNAGREAVANVRQHNSAKIARRLRTDHGTAKTIFTCRI